MRLFRKKARLSQEELANCAGLHRTYIGGIERGERNATMVTISKIAKALQIEPYKLLLKKK